LSILSDIFWYGVVFGIAWLVFLGAYVTAARMRWVENLDRRLIVLALASAAVAGVIAAVALSDRFSNANVLWLATITAPISFVGFCGIFILVGPANVDRSVTLTILRAFKAQEESHSTHEKLIDAVPFDRVFAKRLHELSTHGVIEMRDGRAQLTRRGDRTRRFFLWLGRLLNVTPQ
jgi:hypothetical protein